MANEAIKVIDPLGNIIFLPDEFFQLPVKPGIYDDASTVITKPAFVIEVIRKNEKELYYFRSIGGDHTMLIKVHSTNNHWEAVTYEQDPADERLTEIMTIGKQLL